MRYRVTVNFGNGTREVREFDAYVKAYALFTNLVDFVPLCGISDLELSQHENGNFRALAIY